MAKVLISYATRNSGLTIMRALVAAGHEVLGADDRALPLGLHSRHSKRYLLHAGRNSSELVPSLLKLVADHRPDVFLSEAAGEVSRHRAAFERLTRVLVPPHASYRKAYYKDELLNQCVRLRIPAPRAMDYQEACEALARMDRCDDDARLVVKPTRDIGGAKGVFYVRDRAALDSALRHINERYGRAITTEYVPGPPDAMRCLHLLFDRHGDLAACCVHRKLMQYPPSGGVTALAVTTHEFELVEAILPFFHKWRWAGPADVELKVDGNTGEPKLIEINPRFSGITDFSTACGVNLPGLACELALGKSAAQVGRPSYPAGVKCVTPGCCMKSFWLQWVQSRNRWALLRRTLGNLKGTRVAGAHSLRDCRPFVGKLLLELRGWWRSHSTDGVRSAPRNSADYNDR